MITFITNATLSNLRLKLLFLYILNVIDIVFTVLLLRTGLFVEVNGFMNQVVQNPDLSFLLKILLPIILLSYLYVRLQDATELQQRVSNIFLNLVIAFYLIVNCSHILWTCLYIL